MFKSTKKLVHQFRDHCQIFLRTQKNSQIPFCKPKLNRRVPSRARSAREGTRAFSAARCRRKCQHLSHIHPNQQTRHRESDFSGSMPAKMPWLRRSQDLLANLRRFFNKLRFFAKIGKFHRISPVVHRNKSSPNPLLSPQQNSTLFDKTTPILSKVLLSNPSENSNKRGCYAKFAKL